MAIEMLFTDSLLTTKKGDLKTAPGTYSRNRHKEIGLIGLFEAFLEENTSDGNGDGTPAGINSAEKAALVSSFRQKEHGLKMRQDKKTPQSGRRSIKKCCSCSTTKYCPC